MNFDLLHASMRLREALRSNDLDTIARLSAEMETAALEPRSFEATIDDVLADYGTHKDRREYLMRRVSREMVAEGRTLLDGVTECAVADALEAAGYDTDDTAEARLDAISIAHGAVAMHVPEAIETTGSERHDWLCLMAHFWSDMSGSGPLFQLMEDQVQIDAMASLEDLRDACEDEADEEEED